MFVSEAVVVVIDVETEETAAASFEAVDEIASVVGAGGEDCSAAGPEGVDGVSFSSAAPDTRREDGGALSGVVFVDAESTCCRIRSETVAGVTLSMKVKAGSRRTVVGAEAGGWSSWSGGRGRLDAESINF